MRRGIHHTTVALDELEVLGFLNIAGALKHHVLEQMSEAASAFRFIARADVVVNRDSHNGRRVVHGQNHA
jgi:hypothetical protein